MNGKTKQFKIILLLASLLVVGLIVLNGCKKSEPAPSAEPNEVATRFIVRTHDICKKDIYWKNGIILEREETEALVISERLNRRIRIWVSGDNRKELLAIIRREINYI